MSGRGDIRITQLDKQFSFLRKDASGATPPTGAFTDLDTVALRLDPTDDIVLWSNTTEMFYFGNTSPWAVLGFLVGTIAPDNTSFIIQYYNGSWQTLTFINDSTLGFSRTGYIVWVIPGDWALTTVDGASAYWIRAQSTEVNVAGRAQHFLPLVESKPPVKVLPGFLDAETRNAREVNGILKSRDIPNEGVISLAVDCTTNAFTMTEIHLLEEFAEKRNDLRIDDLARTAPIDWKLDAHYKYYEGRISALSTQKLSQRKMSGDDYVLEFQIDTAVSLFNLLGLS